MTENSFSFSSSMKKKPYFFINLIPSVIFIERNHTDDVWVMLTCLRELRMKEVDNDLILCKCWTKHRNFINTAHGITINSMCLKTHTFQVHTKQIIRNKTQEQPWKKTTTLTCKSLRNHINIPTRTNHTHYHNLTPSKVRISRHYIMDMILFFLS